VATIATLKFTVGPGTSMVPPGKRCIMLVADPGRETTSALEWALSHAILENDEVVFLHVEQGTGIGFRRGTSSSSFSSFLRRPSTGAGEVEGRGIDGEYEFLVTMKAMCNARQPAVQVNIETVEMDERDKATTILAEANRRNVDMIVIGQRRSSFLGYDLFSFSRN
jgi:nucleotide-binding universal stress UspA family protein